MFHLFGFSRRGWNEEQFRQSLETIIKNHEKEQFNNTTIRQFLNLWSYHQGNFDDIKSYRQLAQKLGYLDKEWKVCSNKLFYIAAPPQYYEEILHHLHDSGLTKPCSPEEGFTRVLIEKPFGKNLVTARRLEIVLSQLFKEEQIYRIDHYLAKEMLQNILSFRFSNAIFENSWSARHIEKVRIRLWEKLGVEQRGAFYDGLGALRDVGQNHLLQMLALMTMDNPTGFSEKLIRNKRAEILKTLVIPDKEEIIKHTYRAQYEGYRQIKNVRPNSSTETYFKIRAFLNHPRWRGVPFILESGKKLKEQQKEIIVTFRHPDPCFCPPGTPHDFKNRVVFQLEPDEGVVIDLVSKKPGLHYETKGSKFQFLIRDSKRRTQYVEEYEKLLLDAVTGDQTLFVRSDEVAVMWKFTDPIAETWEKNAVPLNFYRPDSEEPIIASQFIDQGDSGKIPLKKEIGVVGLGKMGSNISRRLANKSWRVVGYNRTAANTKKLENEGIIGAYSLKELVGKLTAPRIIWLMVSAGKPVDEIIFGKEGLINYLEKGDVIIDAGNSFYEDDVRRTVRLKRKKIDYVDIGISGGPSGALNGACLMIGGEKKLFEKLEWLYRDIAMFDGYQFFNGAGAGHFVKMVHNGIEYGMMQAIAEGFAIFKKTKYHLDLTRVADIYNHGSVIESRLIGWLENGLELHGENLADVSGTVGHTGEGEWTVETARKVGVEARIIQGALDFRKQSAENPSYAGKIVSVLREQFGGHAVKTDKHDD